MSLSESIVISKRHRNIKINGTPNVIKAQPIPREQQERDKSRIDNTSPLPPISVAPEYIVREAYQKGIEEGSRRATELLQSEYVDRAEEEQQKINKILGEVESHLMIISTESEQALLKFALGVAAKIVRQELTVNSDIVLNVIKDGIRNIIGVEKIKIRINPQHKNLVQDEKRSIQSMSESIREIIFEPDESIEIGGCIIESDIGNVDARIATQLEQVQKILNEHQ